MCCIFSYTNIDIGGNMDEETVSDAIDKNYGKDKLLDHMLDDWLEADLQEEMEEI